MQLAYHYCSTDTFFKIITTSNIRFSNPFRTNNSLESHWLLHLTMNLEAKDMPHLEANDMAFFHEFIATTFYQRYNYFCEFGIPPYIACFCESGDSYGLWNSYGDQSYGVSIGFDLDLLTYENILEKYQVIYKKEKQIFLLQTFFTKARIEKFRKIEASKNPIPYLDSEIYKFALLSLRCKNPAYSEEKEWRLIYNYIYDFKYSSPDRYTSKLAISNFQFMPVREKIISFIDVCFKGMQPEVILEIIQGANSHIINFDLQLFLQMNCYSPGSDFPKLKQSKLLDDPF